MSAPWPHEDEPPFVHTRRICFIALVTLSCRPSSAPTPFPDPSGHPAATASVVAPAPPAPADPPSAQTPAASAPPAPSASSAPAGPAPLAIEYHVYDHRVSFLPDPVSSMILDHLSVDLVVHSDPGQTLSIGSFQNSNCMLSASSPPPLVSGLACVFNGLVGTVKLVRVHGDQVRVNAIEGPDGLGAIGPTRHWTAGTVTIPEGVAVSDSTVDRDEQLRASSKLPLTIAIQKLARGARVEVGTTPLQSVVIPGWDPSGCKLDVSKRDLARIAFVECPLRDAKSLLLAYVAHEAVEIWLLVNGNEYFASGARTVVGRIQIPRDRRLHVTMTTDPGP